MTDASLEVAFAPTSIAVNRRRRAFDRSQIQKGPFVRTIVNRPDPRGPNDGIVSMLVVKPVQDNSPGVIDSSVAVHPAIVREAAYSADFPYYLDQSLNSRTGGTVRSMFLQGFAANLSAA